MNKTNKNSYRLPRQRLIAEAFGGTMLGDMMEE